jgi:hypothetical protein
VEVRAERACRVPAAPLPVPLQAAVDGNIAGEVNAKVGRSGKKLKLLKRKAHWRLQAQV